MITLVSSLLGLRPTLMHRTVKMDLETINLSSVWFGVGCIIGWVTSDIWTLNTPTMHTFLKHWIRQKWKFFVKSNSTLKLFWPHYVAVWWELRFYSWLEIYFQLWFSCLLTLIKSGVFFWLFNWVEMKLFEIILSNCSI